MDLKVLVSSAEHVQYAENVCQLIAESAKARGTGIAARKPEYIRAKMEAGNAVVAFDGDVLVGFCYVEVWSHNRYVVNSGLVVHPDYRKSGLAREIKRKVFNLARDKYPEAKVFGITTSLAVMKINTELGYKPVTVILNSIFLAKKKIFTRLNLSLFFLKKTLKLSLLNLK